MKTLYICIIYLFCLEHLNARLDMADPANYNKILVIKKSASGIHILESIKDDECDIEFNYEKVIKDHFDSGRYLVLLKGEKSILYRIYPIKDSGFIQYDVAKIGDSFIYVEMHLDYLKGYIMGEKKWRLKPLSDFPDD